MKNIVNNKRIEYIDQIKGMAIILVVLGHTYSTGNGIIVWLNSFHMPLFFIITGYLIRYKECINGKIKFTLKNKMKSLIVPYFVFGCCLSLFYSILAKISDDSFWSTLVGYLKILFSLKGIGPFWFLPCIFIAESLFCILLIKKNRIQTYIITIILFTLGMMIHGRFNDNIGLVLIRSLIAMGFIMFGYWLYKMIYNIDINWLIIIGINLLNIFISKYNGKVDLVSLVFNNIYMYILCSIIGSVGIILLFKKLNYKKLKVLNYFGMNSIIILCTHSLVIQIVRLLDYKIFGNILPRFNIFEGIVFTMIILVITVPIIHMVNNKVSFLIGKKGREKENYVYKVISIE